MTDPVGAIFRQPFAQQVAAFRLRLGNLVPSSAWDDLAGSAQDRGFMVAGAVKADLLADLAAAVERTITEGTGTEAFKRDFRAIVAKRGWTGWTGEDTEAGQAWRMRTIYHTNMRSSFMAGRLAQLRQGKFKYWIYRHGGSNEPRLQHLAWDGLILPSDHPFWVKAFPPNGFGCNCQIFGARTMGGAKRRGGDPSKVLPDDWGQVNPNTGRLDGIGEGWDHAPGGSVADLVQTMAGKTVNWPYAISRAYMDDLPASAQDAHSTAYRNLVSLQDDVRRYAGAVADGRTVAPIRTMGRLSQAHRQRIAEATGQDLDNYHFTLDDSAVRHVLASHGNASEDLRGQFEINQENLALLPRILDQPDSIEAAGTSRAGHSIVRFSRRFGAQIYTVALEIQGNKHRMLVVQSMWGRNSPVRSPI
ncbi:phage head protein [Parasedimentitalea marina]|uniref:Phage head protein n=1 Tax=Parasedimentitalea marina TaxID=2483033 RepID=A0A3T0N1P1_9RHOB|nr:phage minor head protein [Parasedimentitalea marina]AZV77943.1 phage head protein [Parasedimentitalea marina]